MRKLEIDREYLKTTLLELLAIPSPAGLTDEIVHYTGGQLDRLDIAYEPAPSSPTWTRWARWCARSSPPGACR
jgi:aminoglycoside phosphotransferase (APT) family kinase protein